MKLSEETIRRLADLVANHVEMELERDDLRLLDQLREYALSVGYESLAEKLFNDHADLLLAIDEADDDAESEWQARYE